MADNTERKNTEQEEQISDEALESVAGGSIIGIGGPRIPIFKPTVISEPFPGPTTDPIDPIILDGGML